MSPTLTTAAAGELRERLTIQQNTPSTTSQGGRSASWGTLATVWGAVRPVAGDEVLQAASIGSQMPFEMEIRYRADVTAKMRVQWTPYSASAARTFEIHGVRQNPGRPERLILQVGEVV